MLKSSCPWSGKFVTFETIHTLLIGCHKNPHEKLTQISKESALTITLLWQPGHDQIHVQQVKQPTWLDVIAMLWSRDSGSFCLQLQLEACGLNVLQVWNMCLCLLDVVIQAAHAKSECVLINLLPHLLTVSGKCLLPLCSASLRQLSSNPLVKHPCLDKNDKMCC